MSFLEDMENSLPHPSSEPANAAPKGDFLWWRKDKALWIGGSRDDGSLEQWRELYHSEGQAKATALYLAAAKRIGAPPKKVRFSDMLDEMRESSKKATDPVDLASEHAYAAWRSRVSKLVTCLCMGPRFYAAEIYHLGPDTNGPKYEVRSAALGNTIEITSSAYKYPESQWGPLMARAETALGALESDTGISRTKWVALSDRVMETKHLLAYLKAQRLIPRYCKPKVDVK